MRIGNRFEAEAQSITGQTSNLGWIGGREKPVFAVGLEFTKVLGIVAQNTKRTVGTIVGDVTVDRVQNGLWVSVDRCQDIEECVAQHFDAFVPNRVGF